MRRKSVRIVLKLFHFSLRTFPIKKLLPRFLHVKPKAKPVEISDFEQVFADEFRSTITMGLNRSIPNSTDVWWELSESRPQYRFSPSCSFENMFDH